MMKMWQAIGTAVLAAGVTTPLAAQDAGEPGVAVELPTTPANERPETVFDGDYLTIGLGVGYGPSYSGSDDYVLFPLPLVQGSLGGVDFSPRPAGVAIDFLPDRDGGPDLSLGLVARVNSDRADRIKDPVVSAYGELDRAIEVGATAGIGLPGVLNPFDSLSASVDVVGDVAGAHKGMAVAPQVTYFTPLSRAMAVSLSVGTTYIDDDYADYYYSVPAADVSVPGQALPAFQADGGFEDVSGAMLIAYDLSGDVTNGGFSLVGIAVYSRLLSDAKRTPFTSIRGDADQFLLGLGLGYTF
jgi:outer membrane scaffolding protein for murein synthesis (MipA/OmpV family)